MKIISKEFFDKCETAIINGDNELAVFVANQSINDTIDLQKVVESFSKALKKVGDYWEEGEYFLPELMRSAEAMTTAMKILTPVLSEKKITRRNSHRIVIGTIIGDIHDIGKTLITSMLTAEGFEVYDLGTDVSVDKFIEKALEVDAKMICVSALLTTTMIGQKDLIDRLIERKLRDRFIVLVGGAPVSQNWVNEIKADGTADNAVAAVKLATKLLES